MRLVVGSGTMGPRKNLEFENLDGINLERKNVNSTNIDGVSPNGANLKIKISKFVNIWIVQIEIIRIITIHIIFSIDELGKILIFLYLKYILFFSILHYH